MKSKSKFIGKRIEYRIGERTFTGQVYDKTTLTSRETGQPYEMFLIVDGGGRVHRISPAAVTRLITENV